MKTKFLHILIILITIILFSSCQNNDLQIENIKEISITPANFLVSNAENTVKLSDNYTIRLIRDIYNQIPLEEDTVIHEVSYDFIIDWTTLDTTDYQLILDIGSNNKIYVTDPQKGYTSIMSNKNYNDLINSSVFSKYLNLEFEPPEMSLMIDEKEIVYNYDGQFNIQTFNNETKPIQLHHTAINEKTVNIQLESNANYKINNEPDKVIQKIYNDGTLSVEEELDNLSLKLPTDEGDYHIELLCFWNKEDGYFQGEIVYSFDVNLDLPIEFELLNNTILPGDLLVVFAKYVNDNQALSIQTELFKDIQFYPSNNEYVAIIPTNCYTSPDQYTMTVMGLNTDNSVQTEAILDVTILDKTFEVQHLIVSSSTSSLKSDDNAAHDQKYFDDSKKTPIQEKLWDGLFIEPVEGRISTEYGVIRYTNDNPTPRRHYGIDIANSTGTPIAASNTGVVKLAMELITTGNTIVIDHGLGLYSTYMHLDSISIENGESVTKGDLIGTIGTTGYSTGPHLHFSIWKDGAYINPWTLYDIEIF